MKYPSDFFAALALDAEQAYNATVRGNAAMAENRLRSQLQSGLDTHKGTLVYVPAHGRWEVQFGKRDSYWPDGLILRTLRAMQERGRLRQIAKPHPVRKAA